MKKITTIALVSLLSSFAYSQVSYNQEFQVNTQGGFPIQPNISNLTNNNFVVCWQSKNDGDWFGIFSQIFTESGEKVGTEFQVNTYSVEGQQNPDVIGLTNGRFVICWQGKSLWDYSTEIFAQIFKNDGSKIGGEFRVNTNELNYQGKPSIGALNDGKFVICWESNENTNTNGPFKIRCQIFNSEGSKIGNEIVVNPVTVYSNTQPKIDRLSNEGFVVAWRGDNNIFTQLFDVNGIKNGESFQVNTQMRSNQLYPSVSALLNDEFVIAWSSGSNLQKNIYAQKFFNNGSKKGMEFRVNSENENQHIFPQTSPLSDGQYVIAWTTGQYFTEDNILQIYDNTDLKLGRELKIEGPADGIF
ncbi:MAG: hypothetical protein HND52_13160 [Ignavibacteriae bacterium]|nr:hypothetical protein [Ignavibacteriota bacterium]NOG98901.1 hypothetical protein [Ignavibacteriota bacterium]